MNVKECMTSDVEIVAPHTSLVEVARKMKEGDFGAMPICDGKKLLGMITDRDIVIRAIAEGKDVNNVEVRQVMSDQILYCFEDQDVEEAAEIMSKNQIRRLPVVSRDKSLVGMIALGDIAQSSEDEAAEDALTQISKPSKGDQAQARH